MSSADEPGLSRRAALRGGLASAAAACGPRDHRDLGHDSGGEGGRIEHVIMVMMENRSYDHWLGGRSLDEALSGDGLSADMSNPAPDGSAVSPYASDEPCLDDPPHGYTSTLRQINGGAMDGFCTEYAARIGGSGAGVMQYQRRADLPITWALADAFTVCDRWFCSVPGPTWPNRLYGHMASSQGKADNSLPSDGLFSERTVWRALDEAGISWGYYYADLPFIGLFEGHQELPHGRIELIDQLARDVERGELPAVCWIDPAFSYNDNHPPHHPGLGELFLGQIYETFASSALWDKVLIVLTYDEHGGFFDHVAPPTLDDDRAAEGFDQLGVRVPTQLIGPWVKQGVDSTVYDHSSWIRFVCELHGLELWNTRLNATRSLAEGIDWDRMATGSPLPPVELPAFDFDPDSVGDECFYGRVAHLHRLAEILQAQGMHLRLSDRRLVRSPFIREWQRRGLIG